MLDASLCFTIEYAGKKPDSSTKGNKGQKRMMVDDKEDSISMVIANPELYR